MGLQLLVKPASQGASDSQSELHRESPYSPWRSFFALSTLVHSMLFNNFEFLQ